MEETLPEPTQEALDFLKAFTQYIDWRVDPKGPQPTAHITLFGSYLESRKAPRGAEPYEDLMSHMRVMLRSDNPGSSRPGG